MSGRVLVVDYGIGNLHSVQKALAHAGGDVAVTSDPDAVRRAPRLVLPGVGAFADSMRELAARGLVEAVREHVATGRPMLGICVGMQLLLSESMEFGHHHGLGLIPGAVARIAGGDVKVPHVGWNAIAPSPSASWRGTPLEGLEAERPMVYFVHSFTAAPTRDEHRLAEATHGSARICAAVLRDNVVGLQFHPEKSGPVGLRILQRFLAGAGTQTC